MSSQERNLTDMEDGSSAALLQDMFNDFLDEQMRLKVDLLIRLYRANDVSHDQLLGGVAEMAAIHNIINELQVRRERGIRAREKELGDAEKKANPPFLTRRRP